MAETIDRKTRDSVKKEEDGLFDTLKDEVESGIYEVLADRAGGAHLQRLAELVFRQRMSGGAFCCGFRFREESLRRLELGLAKL